MRKTFLVFLSFISISIWIVSASAGGRSSGASTPAPRSKERRPRRFDRRQRRAHAGAGADRGLRHQTGLHLVGRRRQGGQHLPGHRARRARLQSRSVGQGTLLYKTSELDVMALAVDAQGNVARARRRTARYTASPPTAKRRSSSSRRRNTSGRWPSTGRGDCSWARATRGDLPRQRRRERRAVRHHFANQYHRPAGRLVGAIIAGTDPGGLVLRISPEGKVFTLFDSSQREIRELALGRNDEIYALALAESAGSGATNAAPASGAAAPQAPTSSSSEDGSVTITISDLQVIDTSSATPGSSSAGGQSKSAVYRLDANGASDTIWDSKESVAFALTADGDGRVLVGTGQKGRIYQAAAGKSRRSSPRLPRRRLHGSFE